MSRFARFTKAVIVGIASTAICAVIMVIFAFVLPRIAENDAEIRYDDLNYTVRVDDAGNLAIKQTVTMTLRQRSSSKPWRQLYQVYNLRSTDVNDITVQSVKNVTTGETYDYRSYSQVDTAEVPYSSWDNVAAKTWYMRLNNSSVDYTSQKALPVESPFKDAQSTQVEIGWNIPKTLSGTMTFEINMTWRNVATAYNDATYFKWEPVGDTNQIPITKVSADITLPESVLQSWNWLHYSGKSVTKRIDDKHLTFTAEKVEPGEHIDLVSMYTDPQAASMVQRRVNAQQVEYVKDQEAREEQAWNEKKAWQARFDLLSMLVAIVGCVVLAVWLLWGALRSLKASRYTGPIDYFREPVPISPAAAAQLYALMNDDDDSRVRSRAISATMLSLVSKKALYILPGKPENYERYNFDAMSADQLDNIPSFLGRDQEFAGIISKVLKKSMPMTFILPPEISDDDFAYRHHLSDSEFDLLDLLAYVSAFRHTRVFGDKDIKRVARSSKSAVSQKYESLIKSIKSEYTVLRQDGSTFAMRGLPMIFAVLFVLFSIWGATTRTPFALYVITVLCVTAVWGFALIYGKSRVLRNPEDQLAGQVHGLAAYMQDFSDFSDRTAPDLKLWDRYLVYAVAFGISTKFIQQMRTVYESNPEMGDAVGNSMMWWMFNPYHHFGYGYSYGPHAGVDNIGGASGGFFSGTDANFSSFDNFAQSFQSSFDSIGSSLNSAFAASTVSDSSSSGGSFSSGGFGGTGGGAGGGSFGGR